MLKLFNHYVPSNTLVKLLFDALLLSAAVVGVFYWDIRMDLEALRIVVPSAFVFALTMMALNGALGLYQSACGRGIKETLMRIAMLIALSVPVAYGIFQVLPWNEMTHQALEINVILLLGFVVSARGLSLRRAGSGLFVKRIMVIGTGADAVAVDEALNDAANPGLQMIGFYQAGSVDEQCVDTKRILRTDGSLLEVARKLQVNEIIVAVKERRGGVLPLRELLDCKLAGVKVCDLSTFFERVQGQVRDTGWPRPGEPRCTPAAGQTLQPSASLSP